MGMSKGRLEAFSDGVIAIIMTIMVLELRPPQGSDWDALRSLVPGLFSYALSFVFMGIYWNNHHHLLQAARRVDGRVLWANLLLLFWLSLTPATTAWMSASHFAPWPVAVYGGVLLLSGLSYYVLTQALVAVGGHDSPLARAVGGDLKGRMSLVLYGTAVFLALSSHPQVACAIYVLVAVIWLVPDRRIERTLAHSDDP
jgi:uncharacterized membrane protein